MKDLGKWQFISMLSQGIAMVLGMVGTFVIIRILTVGEWGVVQLAMSIGGTLGIYQHLGLVSASTREISSAKNDKDIFKIFVTSAVVRYCVTLPIALGLFFLSKHIAVNLYHNEDLITPLRLYSTALLFQGIQGILNSVISGTKRFKHLFLYQIIISVVNILIFIPFVYFFKINGYFYGFLIFNIISSIALSIIAFKPLKGKLIMPSKKDFVRLFKEIFSISIAIYLVKILYTNWQKFGNNVLGLYNSTEVVAIFAFALLYAEKIMMVSDSITTVNIPMFSERYVNDFKEFKASFEKNFNKLFSFIIFTGTFAAYFAPFLINILVGGKKYDEALVLVAPVITAFVIYSFINIITSSVMIPAKLAKSMIGSYVFLLVGTVLSFFILRGFINPLLSVSWSMVVGSVLGLVFVLYWVKKRLGFSFFNIDHVVIIIQGFAISMLCGVNIPFLIKLLLAIPLFGLLIWGFFESKFIDKNDIKNIFGKFSAISKKRSVAKSGK